MTTYSLDELTEQAGVTVRTVRYYIAEGLLPPPVGGGPRSAYTEGHLDRLRLIGRLKDAYLPLRAIRHRVAGLSDDEVRAALTQAERSAGTEPVDSAADYIARVLNQQQPTGESQRSRPDRGSLAMQAQAGFGTSRREEMPPLGFADVAETAPPVPSAGPMPAEPSTWRRLPISDEAELLIREDAYQRRAEQIDGLIAWVKRVLG